MSAVQITPNAAAAKALAFVVAEDGFVEDFKLRRLERCEAFRELGMSRDGLSGLIRSRLASIDGSLHERSWLPSHIEDSFNDVLDAVPDPEQRVLVCRLAAAVIGAGTSESQHQRLLFNHMLAHWRISLDAVRAGDKGNVPRAWGRDSCGGSGNLLDGW